MFVGVNMIFSTEFTSVETRGIPPFLYLKKTNVPVVAMDVFRENGFWSNDNTLSGLGAAWFEAAVICKKKLGKGIKGSFGATVATHDKFDVGVKV